MGLIVFGISVGGYRSRCVWGGVPQGDVQAVGFM